MRRDEFGFAAVFLSAFFLLNATALGQITITSEDIPSEIGCRHALRTSLGYVPVVLGPLGRESDLGFDGCSGDERSGGGHRFAR